jgi:hypothetical protein
VSPDNVKLYDPNSPFIFGHYIRPSFAPVEPRFAGAPGPLKEIIKMNGREIHQYPERNHSALISLIVAL